MKDHILLTFVNSKLSVEQYDDFWTAMLNGASFMRHNPHSEAFFTILVPNPFKIIFNSLDLFEDEE